MTTSAKNSILAGRNINKDLRYGMDSSSNYLLTLLKHAINGTELENPSKEVDWTAIKKQATGHNIYTIIFPTVRKLPKDYQPAQELMELWERQTMQQGIHQFTSHRKLERIVADSRKQGISLFVVKGVGIAELYPDPLLRVSGDSDLIVEEKDMEPLREVMRQHNFQLDEEACYKYEMTFRSEDGMNIEVHSSLWEEPEGERRSLLESLNLVTKDTVVLKNACGIEVPLLTETEHLAYIIYHMIKHFFISGIGIRHLTDLTLFVSKHMETIDFDRFWDNMKKLGYDKFCYKAFYLSTKYFDMPKELLPPDCREDDSSCEKMLEDIMEAGVFGGSSAVRWKSGRFLRFYYENQNKRAPKSKLSMMVTFLFPKSEELDNQSVDKYKRSRFLPLTWIKRGRYFYQHWKRDKKSCTIRQRVDCASKRMELLRNMDLMR